MNGYLLNGHGLHNLYARQLSPDPQLSLHTFKESCYSSRSFVGCLRLEMQLKEHEGCMNCINVSPSGELLASGSDDLLVVLWDRARGRKVAKIESGHYANVFQVCREGGREGRD